MSASLELTIEERIARTIHDLKTKWGETKISVNTIHLVLRECMELVENYNCSGTEKKAHVITIVNELVKDLVENEDEERMILELIDKKVLENTVELIISASKGKLNINNKKTQKKLLSCFKTTLPIIINVVIHIINSCKKPKTTTQSNKSKDPMPPPPSPIKLNKIITS